jgi:hypothetical protein
MKTEIFVLCDFAADYGGKFNVVGAFESIYAHQLPAVHQFCCIAVRMRFDKIEEGEKRVKLLVCDQDGKAVLPPIEIPVKVAMPAEVQSHPLHVVGNIAGLKLERFGEYSIDLAIDGRLEASVPFFVRQMPQRPTA